MSRLDDLLIRFDDLSFTELGELRQLLTDKIDEVSYVTDAPNPGMAMSIRLLAARIDQKLQGRRAVIPTASRMVVPSGAENLHLQDQHSWLVIFTNVFKDFGVSNRHSVIVVSTQKMAEWVSQRFDSFLRDFCSQNVSESPDVSDHLYYRLHTGLEFMWRTTLARLWIVSTGNWQRMRGRIIHQVYYHPGDVGARDFCLGTEVQGQLGFFRSRGILEPDVVHVDYPNIIKPFAKKKPRRMIQI